MANIYEDISRDSIFNQITELASDFIKEQLKGTKGEYQIKKYVKDYLSKLKKIRGDRSGSSKIYYIIIDGKVIGYEVAVIGYDKSRKCIFGEKPGLYITPEYRGQKIDGQFILRILDGAVEDWFKEKEVKYQMINTLAINKRQIHLYEREGYKEIKRKSGVVYLRKYAN